jgi:hypothetical protein
MNVTGTENGDGNKDLSINSGQYDAKYRSATTDSELSTRDSVMSDLIKV